MLTALVITLVIGLFVVAIVAIHGRATARVEPPVVVDGAIAGVEAVPGEVPRGPALPVVLVHGLFGFDRIGVPGARFDYFRGIAKHLGSLGCHAHAVKLPASGSVPARAQKLVELITALPHERIDLIAHSLGGLDARYALAKLGLAARVRSLVTIGTPHHGSPLADLVLKGPIDRTAPPFGGAAGALLPAVAWAHRVMRAIGLPLEAVEWLSTEALARFNAEITDVPGVRYACVVGGMHRDDTPIALPLIPAHAYLRRVAGTNDGLVPVSSQYWGETLAEIEADHFAQIGWRMGLRSTFEAAGLYAFLVARLGDAPGVTGSPSPTVSVVSSAPS